MALKMSSAAIETIGRFRDRIINGPIGSTLLWLGLPLMIVQLVNISYNIADAYWLSKYSDIAYAAPRQTWPYFMFINAIAQGISAANMAIISQYIGSRDYESAKRVVSYFVSTMLLVNAVVMILFFTLRPLVFTYIIATPPELYEYVMSYSGVISLDLLIAALTACYGTIFQAIGDTRTPSRIGVISSVANIVLDPVFIFGIEYRGVKIPAMGVLGAAIATVLSRLVGLIILLGVLNWRYGFLRPHFTLSVSGEWLKATLKAGVPVTLMMMSNSLAFMFQHRLVNAFGAYVAAAFAIGFILMDLADAVLWGFTFAVSTMIGQAIGAGLEKRARSVAAKSMLYIGVSTGIGSIIVLLLRDWFIGVFTSIPGIAREAGLFVLTFAPTLAFFALFFVGMSIGRGSGHNLYPTAIGILRLWGFRIALGYYLAFEKNLGTLGLWAAMSLSNLFSGIAIVPWALRGKWFKPIVKTMKFASTAVSGSAK
jgi:putative MATE family efflux protein